MRGHEVAATLAGRKTQARRVMDPQPHPKFLARGLVAATPQWPHQDGVRFFMADGMSELVPRPLGAPGDRLWVRETWAPVDTRLPAEQQRAVYAADYTADDAPFVDWRWYSPATMPRWASRLFVVLTGLRVERLHDITVADIIADGIEVPDVDYAVPERPDVLDYERTAFAREAFSVQWDADHGKRKGGAYRWVMNPWVWVPEFRRVEA